MSVRVVCGNCGSEDVFCESISRWNVDTQEWELSPIDASPACCEACGGKTTLLAVAVVSRCRQAEISALMEALSRQDFYDFYAQGSGIFHKWITGEEDQKDRAVLELKVREFLNGFLDRIEAHKVVDILPEVR